MYESASPIRNVDFQEVTVVIKNFIQTIEDKYASWFIQ